MTFKKKRKVLRAYLEYEILKIHTLVSVSIVVRFSYSSFFFQCSRSEYCSDTVTIATAKECNS